MTERLADELLRLTDLRVAFRTDAAEVHAVNGVDLTLRRGESLAIVGESGCGKSTLAMAIMGLLPARRAKVSGAVHFAGHDLTTLSQRQMADVRGRRVAMIFQDPLTSLTPYLRVGRQISEQIERHLGLAKKAAAARAIELLASMGIPDAAVRAQSYPHEFSGGMRQRVMIAMALSCDPEIIVADEPTTALDVTTQAQILDLMRSELTRRGMSLLLITHDLGIVANVTDRVAVMYGGMIVESGCAAEIFAAPAHPYTRALLQAVPRLSGERKRELATIAGRPPILQAMPVMCTFAPRCEHAEDKCRTSLPALEHRDGEHLCRCVLVDSRYTPTADVAARVNTKKTETRSPILSVRDVEVTFHASGGGIFGKASAPVKAVAGVSFDVYPGEVLGLAGESGCGKSTLVRTIVQLIRPTAGRIIFAGDTEMTVLRGEELRRTRRKLQMVFQDPLGSLNGRMRVGAIIAEPLINFRLARSQAARLRARELMEQVGLSPSWYDRYPHEFSGGQCQRIAIARALASEPEVLLCDEPVSALDVSVQAQILNLLQELRQRLGLAMVFISHDLAVVRHIADRVMVMREGVIVEEGETEKLFANPAHPYTRELLAAVPQPAALG